MVRCEFCVFYVGESCTSPGGKNYNKDSFNPHNDIACDNYIDNGIVMGFIPDDGLMDDMFLLD